jgi:hypothetical protein
MKLFRQKSDSIADAEREVADLERRRARLADQLQHSEAEYSALLSERRVQLVETDCDLAGREPINSLRDRVAELSEAIGEIDSRISTSQTKLGELRDQATRQAEAARRRKEIEAARAALVQFAAAADALVEKLRPLAILGAESAAAADNMKAFAPQLVTNVEVGLAHSEAYITQMLAGGAPIKHEPMPIEPPPPKPPEIERQLVFLRQASRWMEGDEVRTCGPHVMIELPVEVARAALEFNHAVPVGSQVAADLRALQDPCYAYWPPDRCADLTQPRTAPQPPEQTVTAPSVHSEFIAPRKAIIGTAIAR